MIVSSYIIREFFRKLAITTSITLIISLLITGVESVLTCGQYCNAWIGIKKSLYTSILFVESSMFFAIITSVVWLTTTLSKTNQYAIIAIYSKKKTTIAKPLIISIISFSVFYALILNSMVMPNIRNYISSNKKNGVNRIEKVWINTLRVSNDSTSGSIYYVKNIGKYLDGYSSDSLSIYKIQGGYLTSYKKFNKPFLTASMDNHLMFIYRDPSGKISRNIENDVMISDVELEFKRESHQDNIGFVESASILIDGDKSGNKDRTQAQIIVVATIESIVIFFLAVILSICEFPMYHQRFDGRVRGRILRVLLFSIMCYTSLEILKIIGGGTVGSYIASLTCGVAFFFVFLSRLIKHHH